MGTINVALIGQGFMGRSHSNAWGQVAKFFKPPLKPVMHTVFGQPDENPQTFADNWGWKNASTDWRALVASPEIGLVDIVTPNYMHAPPARAAIEAGKPVAFEKPIAGTLDDARVMVEAAKAKGVKTFVWFNYRRVPAVALAHKMVTSGELGEIRHVRAVYLQDWADESVPLLWRFEKKWAGSGAHGDLNAHIIDMTRFVTGQEITLIAGALPKRSSRSTLAGGTAGGGLTDGGKAAGGKEPVTVDDAVLFLARFSGGAVASFEAARQATGNQNRNGFEINGTKGSLKFNFEQMNELEYYDAAAAGCPGLDQDHVHSRRRPSLRGQLVARRPHHRLRARIHQPGLRHFAGAGRAGTHGPHPRLRRRLQHPAGARSCDDLRASAARSTWPT